jgi:hypothetical protein
MNPSLEEVMLCTQIASDDFMNAMDWVKPDWWISGLDHQDLKEFSIGIQIDYTRAFLVARRRAIQKIGDHFCG